MKFHSMQRCPTEHPSKHSGVQRVDCVPVEKAEQTNGVEYRRLANHRAVAVRLDLELEPGASGKLHLRDQTQPAVRLVGLDPPEIDGISHRQLLRVAATTPHAHPTEQQINETAQPPQPIM